MPAPDLTRAVLRLRECVRAPNGTDRTDGQLLDAFRTNRCEEAFALLVRRHGPTVLGVCRRVLGHRHDAEDAFQAVFLVLARRAHRLRQRESVAAWLYGVALRTARKARALAARRRLKEGELRALLRPDVTAASDDCDWKPLLDRELARLPEKYRLPVLLCNLAGRSRRDVARQLRIPEGTLSSRLARAHALLRDRLVRAGVTLSAVVLTEALTEQMAVAVPAGWVEIIMRVALTTAEASAAPGAALLAEGVMQAMWWNKVKVTVVVVAIGLATGMAGVVTHTERSQATAPGQGSPATSESRAAANHEPTLKQRPEAPMASARPSNEFDKLQGTWRPVKIMQGTQEMRMPRFGWKSLTIRGDAFTLAVSDSPNYDQKGHCVIDETTRPHRLVLEGMDLSGTAYRNVSFFSFEDEWLVFTSAFDWVKNRGNASRLYLRRSDVGTADTTARDQAAIQGTWRVVSKEVEGKAAATGQIIGFKDDNVIGPDFTRDVSSVAGTPHDRFHLDATQTPRIIDRTNETAPSYVQRGIYLLEGDTLLLCFSDRPDQRPTSFSARAGSKQVLLVLSRKPAERKPIGTVTQERQRLLTEEASLLKRRTDLDARMRKLQEELDQTRQRLREVRDRLDRPGEPKRP